MIRFLVGDPPALMQREAEWGERAIGAFRNEEMIWSLRVWRQVARCLQGDTQPPSVSAAKT